MKPVLGVPVGQSQDRRAADEGVIARTHETPVDVALNHPLQTLAGIRTEMTHRSGFGAGLRAEGRLDEVDRLGGYVGLRAELYPDRHPAPVYLALGIGLAVDIGPPRSAAAP